MKRLSLYGAVVALLQALLLLIAPAAQAREKLVLAFGDSLTAGYGLKQADSFPAKLQAALRARGIAARVHNGGVSGDTSAGGKARLGWLLASLKAKPDLVILELGANDMLRGLKPTQTRANLNAMIVELKKRGIPVLLAGMRAAPNMGKAYGEEFDAVYPALARAHGVALYPFFLAGVAAQRPLLLADQIHPNPRGVDVIVAGIMPRVLALLK